MVEDWCPAEDDGPAEMVTVGAQSVLLVTDFEDTESSSQTDEQRHEYPALSEHSLLAFAGIHKEPAKASECSCNADVTDEVKKPEHDYNEQSHLIETLACGQTDQTELSQWDESSETLEPQQPKGEFECECDCDCDADADAEGEVQKVASSKEIAVDRALTGRTLSRRVVVEPKSTICPIDPSDPHTWPFEMKIRAFEEGFVPYAAVATVATEETESDCLREYSFLDDRCQMGGA